MRILVVRLSALGDIVHALPAITDLRRAHPEAVIDMAVDARFADIPRLHAGVDHVIPLALKQWKRNLFKRQTWLEFGATLRALRTPRYDLVVDLHGLNKSAIVTWLARSPLKVGMARENCGEWLAPRLYDQTHLVDHRGSRIAWLRSLMARALGREVHGPADFSLKVSWRGQQASRIAMVHGTTDPLRLWPEQNWIDLGRYLVAQGHELVFPWGNEEERARATRLVAAIDAQRCTLGPTLSIAGWATELSQCRMVIGLDTGLVHIAAAAGVPCLGIFTFSDPALLTTHGGAPLETVGGQGGAAPVQDVIDAYHRLQARTGAYIAGTAGGRAAASSSRRDNSA